MRDKLKQYVDLLFAGTPGTQDIKEEILQNTLDRYDDLIAQGKTPEAAYQLAISGIGDVSELLGSEPTQEPPREQPKQAKEKPLWKRILFAVAIFLYIVSAIPLIVLSSMNMEAIGICGTLAIAAVATPLMIIACSGTKAEHSDIEKEENKSSRSGNDGIFWLIGTILYLLLSFATGAWHITWIIFCIIPCVTAMCSNTKTFATNKLRSVIKIILWSLLILILVGILIAGLVGEGISIGYSEFAGLPGGTETSSAEINPDTIQNIDIRWVGGKVILQRDSSAQTLTFHEEKGASEKSLAYRLDGNTLTIAFMKESTWNFGIQTGNQDKNLIVTIPDHCVQDKLTINSVSAEIRIIDLMCDEVDVITVSGDVSIESTAINSVEIGTVSGDVEYTGSILEFQAETVSGDCELTTILAPDEIEFESVSGGLKLNIPENMGFVLNHDSVSGDITTDIPLTSGKGRKTYGNGECSISTETVSGNVSIYHNK